MWIISYGGGGGGGGNVVPLGLEILWKLNKVIFYYSIVNKFVLYLRCIENIGTKWGQVSGGGRQHRARR